MTWPGAKKIKNEWGQLESIFQDYELGNGKRMTQLPEGSEGV